MESFSAKPTPCEGGEPVGKAAGETFGPYGEVTKRYRVDLEAHEVEEPRTTFKPYWVGDAAGEVAVLARNNDSGQQVWSASHGYPGDFWYREFHKKDGESGMQYWRVGGAGLDLAYKPTYDPEQAAQRARSHAEHFAGLVTGLLTDYASETGGYGIISAAYDTELFGHWWFEGVAWLKEVLRLLSAEEAIELTTAGHFVDTHSPESVLDLPESSWGAGGNHFTWMNVDTKWMWPLIHAAESRMETLAAGAGSYDSACEPFLAQAARELVLLESSDWPFLVTTGQAREYASERFVEHLERFNRLAAIIETGRCGEPEPIAILKELEYKDNPFPTIDYRDFASRQGDAAVHSESGS